MKVKRSKRTHFNKIAMVLAGLYDRDYREVLALYNQMNGDIEHTKMILNISK